MLAQHRSSSLNLPVSLDSTSSDRTENKTASSSRATETYSYTDDDQFRSQVSLSAGGSMSSLATTVNSPTSPSDNDQVTNEKIESPLPLPLTQTSDGVIAKAGNAGKNSVSSDLSERNGSIYYDAAEVPENGVQVNGKAVASSGSTDSTGKSAFGNYSSMKINSRVERSKSEIISPSDVAPLNNALNGSDSQKIPALVKEGEAGDEKPSDAGERNEQVSETISKNAALMVAAAGQNKLGAGRSHSVASSSTSLTSSEGQRPSAGSTSLRQQLVSIGPTKSNQSLSNAASLNERKRSSVSSQASISSSAHDSTAGRKVSQHKASFSFSRRSIAVPPAPLLATASTNTDPATAAGDIASQQEIERLREEIIAQREQKKRRREFLEDEKVLVGTKVSEGHVNFVTAYNMLTGIRVSVSRCNAKVDRELTDKDFTAENKLAFDISGNELTPSTKYDFKFKDYAPWVFRHLRELFRLDPGDYLMSLTSKYIMSELGSPGKSGSFFYFSRDFKFIIKTIHHAEHKMLRKILKDYYNHVKNNPDTLISQFYGLHRVKLPFGRKVHFVVMNNLFPPHRDIHRTYDLKGSTLGRMLVEDPRRDGQSRKSVVYKDLNWIENKEMIRLGPPKGPHFLKQLELDVALLKRLNIMDYSLLIGIHDIQRGNTENIRDSTLQVFEPHAKITKDKAAELRKALNSASPTALKGLDYFLDKYDRTGFEFYSDSGGYRATDEDGNDLPEIYYLGVIDILTNYTMGKRIETFWKGLSHSRESISAVPASEYGDRFLKFIKSVLNQRAKPENTIGGSADPAGPSGTRITEDANTSHLSAVEEAT